MKRSLFLLLWILMAGAHAQSVSAVNVDSTQPTADAERARINAERARLDAGFLAEEAACYQRFMVNNCLEEIKLKRRQVTADLKQQEIVLEEQARKIRAAEQIRKTEEKSSPEEQQAAAQRRALALKDFDARMEREQQKNADRAAVKANEKANADSTAERVENNQHKAIGRSNKQAAMAEEVRKFNERQQRAKERQARHDREQSSRTKPTANPLPQPQ